MSSAKLFTHVGGQAGRPPEESGVEGTEVHVRRVGYGVVRRARAPADAHAMIDALSAFAHGVKLQREQPPVQERAANVREFERVPGLRVENWASSE